MKAKFSPVKYIERRQIIVDPKTFQGRQNKFAEETVNKIVREGFDLSEDPIIVWKNPAGKFVVVSGHSRFEASGRLYKAGDKRLKTMPVKVFQGTRDQAADYALLESNRSGTAEGLKSDLSAYKRAVSKGYNREYLKGIFKPESKLNLLQKLASLDPNGRFLEYLGSTQEKSFPYLRRNSEWVGTIRQMYPISDAHEAEIFNYLYKSKKGLTVNKQSFFDLMERKAGNMFFDKTKPLNLLSVTGTNHLTREGDEAIKALEKEIDELRRERDKKQNLIVQARRTNNAQAEEKLKNDIKGIDRALLNNLTRIENLKKGNQQARQAGAMDLFSQTESIVLKYSVNDFFKTKNMEVYGLSTPAESLRKKLRYRGFKWSPWNKCWYKKNINENDIQFVKSFASVSGRKSKLEKR